MSDTQTQTEIEAIGHCCEAFDALPPEAHKRLLQYLADRYLVAAAIEKAIEKKLKAAAAAPSEPPPFPVRA